MNEREQWLENRRAGIGGSDAAAALGLSKWTTPLELYLDKRGEAPAKEESEPMKWGSLLEPVIRQQYAERTGRIVTQPTDILRHPTHQFMLANVDGIADGRLVEIKTARSPQEWGEAGTDEVPAAYLIQVQHYLTVTALAVAEVAVLVGGSEFRLYEIPADRELQEMIVEGEAEFWDKVQKGTPPEPRTLADAMALWGRASRSAIVQAQPEALAALARLHTVRAELKALEGIEEDQKAILLRNFGEADTLADGTKILATWKAAKAAERIDSAALKVAMPDVYQRFLKTGAPSRRLLLK